MRSCDVVRVYIAADLRWTWSRMSQNHRKICHAGQTFGTRFDCVSQAMRVNAGPYILEVKGPQDA